MNRLVEIARLWAPPEQIKLSEWAEQNIRLSPEYSNKTGPLQLYAWQREIFNSFTDPRVEQSTIMCGVQLVKTLFIMAASAYVMAVEPGPILVVEPSDKDAKGFSKERLSPMIRDCAVLTGRVSDKKRDSTSTIDHKEFIGGALSLVGAIAPGNLARRSIRYLFCDEIDKYLASAGDEGDPIALAIERTATYASRSKIILTCSPTIEGESRIAQAYEESDQRKPYVACHHCGHWQILRFFPNVEFESKLAPVDAGRTARYRCENDKCSALWTDAERNANVERAVEWRAHAPFSGKAGFWISHMYSNLPAHSMARLTEKFLKAQGHRERLQVFMNADLAELWEEQGERPDHEILMAHAEDYLLWPDGVVPAWAVLLTAGVDVQAKRLECIVLAHGQGGQSAVADWRVIECFESNGQPKMTSAPEYLARLEEVLMQQYRHATGAMLPIIAMGIDVGHNPEPVYEFAQRHARPSFGSGTLRIQSLQTVVCVRGHDSENLNAIHRVSDRESARQRKGAGKDLPIVTLGTGYLKQQLYSALNRKGPEKTIHLPRCLGEEWFRGLASEKRVHTNRGEVKWRRIYTRNEPLDTWVYAMGARAIFYPSHIQHSERLDTQWWAKLRDQLRIPQPEAAPVESSVISIIPTPAYQRESWFGDTANWLNR